MARHLVAAGTLVDDDPAEALKHARAARDRASRVAAVREAVGVAAYHAGDYAEAARELRAYRRMSGDLGYRAVLADCERALGRPEVALRLVAEAVADAPDSEELVELRLVESGVRRDLGELPAARLVLEDALGGRPVPAALTPEDPGRLRLAAAYAELLAESGEPAGAAEWRSAVAEADVDDVTGLGSGPDVEFAEEAADGPIGEPPAREEPSAPVGTADSGGAEFDDVDVEDADDVDPEDVDSEDVDPEDVEAEVAELLGEDHPLAAPPEDGAQH